MTSEQIFRLLEWTTPIRDELNKERESLGWPAKTDAEFIADVEALLAEMGVSPGVETLQ